MKLLYIVKSIEQYGGLDRVLSEKMNYLAEKLNHDIYLITYELGNHPFSFPISSKIHHYDINVRFFTIINQPIYKRIFKYIKMRYNFKKRLHEKIRNINPNTIICMTDSFPILNIIIRESINYNIIIENHVDKCDYLKAPHYKNPLFYQIFNLFDKYIISQIKLCNRFIVLTQNDYNSWINGLPQISIIPNPISYIPDNQSSLQKKQIISVGRLTYQKGFDLLIKSWKIVSSKHKDWHLCIYGDGNDLTMLQKEIISNDIHNVTIHKAISNIYEKYLESSIYVMSSRYEGFGLVLIEAMSCGLPCISFDCPSGPSEIIKHGHNGLLVENGNIIKLAENIIYLIENDEARSLMGNNAKSYIKRYHKDTIMNQWEQLLKQVIKSK